MKPSKIVPADSQQHYWHVVRECLLRFHGLNKQQANGKIQRLRKRVEELPQRAMALFFHTEAFYVACELTGNELELREHQNAYIAIRDAEDGDADGRSAGAARYG